MRELQKEGYVTHVEPQNPPLNRLYWGSYRPDVLGVKNDGFELMLTLVECETRPNSKGVRGKTSKLRLNLSLQKRLNERHVFRPLLVIPPGSLHKVNQRGVRRFWEIWVVNKREEIVHKIPKKQ